jgi:hypothetical protein
MGRAQLETLLARHCRAQGYAVESAVSGAMGAKFGDAIDMVLRRDDEFVLVQCRHWTTTTVPPDAVQALLDVMGDLDATGGVMVTRGVFSSAAVEVASRQGRVELVDHQTLSAMLGPIPELDEDPPLGVDAGPFDQGACAGDNLAWVMLPGGGRARSGAVAGVPSGRLLLSLGLKLTLAFALVLLFAWAIDTAVHPLLQPLRLHRVTAPAGSATSASMARDDGTQGAPLAGQDTVDDATPDAWHQPSQDEIIEQQRRAQTAQEVPRDDAPAL